MNIERWTPKIKQEQCSEGMTLRMWTDKEGEYVLYADHIKAVKEAHSAADVCELLEYVAHDSWRCAYYQECHCGLNALTDKMGLRRVPVPDRST